MECWDNKCVPILHFAFQVDSIRNRSFFDIEITGVFDY
jgi:hypothetical protein